MDAHHFDDLARSLSSRRTALGALLAGLLLPVAAVARDKSNRKSKDNGKAKRREKRGRATAQVEPCWRAAACIPGKNTNVSRCDLSRYTTFPTLDSTGSNLSRANLRGVGAQGVNFSKANLSYACLVDADFTGATFANSTNLGNAIFCRTIMPNGLPNNSGCDAGTPCCPTCSSSAQCEAGQICTDGSCEICVPRTCGNDCGPLDDGCGNTLQCVTCPTCPDGFQQAHGGCFQICNPPGGCSNGECACVGNITENFLCANFQGTPCTSSENCPVGAACRTHQLGSACWDPCGG